MSTARPARIGVFGSIDYDRLLETLEVYVSEHLAVFLHSPTSFIPKDTTLSIVVPNGTPPDVEFELEILPPLDDYMLDIRAFKLTPDAELLINMRAVGHDGRETWLFADDIDGDAVTGEQVFDVEGIWERLLVRKLILWVKTKTTLTADRAVTLKLSGGVVKWHGLLPSSQS